MLQLMEDAADEWQRIIRVDRDGAGWSVREANGNGSASLLVEGVTYDAAVREALLFVRGYFSHKHHGPPCVLEIKVGYP